MKFWKVSKLYPKHVEGISKMKQDEGSIPSASTGMFPCLEKQGGGVGHNPSVDLKFKGEFIPL